MAKAKSKKTDEKAEKEEAPKRKFPMLKGLIIGVIIGFATGWIVRPPDSFPLEDLRDATEKKFLSAKDSSRVKVADWAESLAKKLREDD